MEARISQRGRAGRGCQSKEGSHRERQTFVDAAVAAGCPEDQVGNFILAGVLLQERQLAASAAARLCDQADGPTAVGYGGARGGGKSHWLLAQMGADDCQRVPGLKCLLLRKVGKANLEHFEDLRRRLFSRLPHEFSAFRGVLTFGNGSRIIAGHFQAEKDIDAYLGLEYDVIGIEEATTLSSRKHQDITTCCRTSKPNWRPRIYSHDQSRRGWACLVSDEVHRAVSGEAGDGDAVRAGAGGGQRVQQPGVSCGCWRGLTRLAEAGLAGWGLGHCGRAVLHDVPARGACGGGFRRHAGGGVVCGAGLRLHALHGGACWRARMGTATCSWWMSTRSGCGCRSGTRRRSRRCWRGTRALERRLDASWICGGSWPGRMCSAGRATGRRSRRSMRGQGITLRPANMDRVNGWAEVLQRLGDPEGGIAADACSFTSGAGG